MAAGRATRLPPNLHDPAARCDDTTADRDLLQRFAARRDEAAFAEIVRRHGPMLARLCRRVLHCDADAEDVCQAAFLLLAQKATAWPWHASVAGWLFQAAYRLCLKARVRASRRSRHEARAKPAVPPDPAAEVTMAELQAILDAELSRLPERYRAPILLCCLEGRSRDEAARCLGWPLTTVKDRLEQGRERLRARLARRGLLLGTTLLSAWLLGGTARASCLKLAPAGLAQAALALRSGRATLTDLLPARIAKLAKGATTTMFIGKVTAVALVGLVLGLTVMAAGTNVPTEEPPVSSQTPAASQPPKEAGAVQPESLALGGHAGAVNAVAFDRDGRTLATAGADKTVRVWDLATGGQVRKLDQPGEAAGVAFSPDGQILASASAGQVGALIAYDASGKLLWRNPGNDMPGGAVAFSPDGRVLMACFGVGYIQAFDVRSGRVFFALKVPAREGKASLAISPDGKSGIVTSGGGSIYHFDSASGRIMQNWPGQRTVTALAFLPNGVKVLAADGGRAIRVLDVAGGKEETAFEEPDPVSALALSGNGKWLATASAGGVVLLWDVAAGKLERRFTTLGGINAVALSSDGRLLATAGTEGAVVWDLTRDEKPLPKDLVLTAKELDALWADLASDEAGKAYAAGRLLRADSARAVPFLRDCLKPKEPGPDDKKLKQLIADLDSDQFKKRDAATKELEKLGVLAENALRSALAANPPLEMKNRLERLIKLLGGEGKPLTAAQQRDVRAVRVLERTATAEARQVLEGLLKESPSWWVRREAKEAMQRLAAGGK